MRKANRSVFHLCVVTLILVFSSMPSRGSEWNFDLPSAIQFALRNNPSLRSAQRSIEAEAYGIETAKADRLPKFDLGSGITRYRYPTPLTPIVIEPPLVEVTLPDFEKTIYDGGISFRLALFRGGRIVRNIRIAEMRKSMAEDNYGAARQDLAYNVTSVYHKILQLQRLLVSNEASVNQLERHRKDVEEYLRAGTVARVDLLSTEVELAHARQNALMVRNNLQSALELLRNLMGLDEPEAVISIVEPPSVERSYPSDEEAIGAALKERPDYRAIAKKQRIAEERVKAAQGKRLPDVSAAGEYVKRAGENTDAKENWYVGARMTFPLFDGGLITAEIGREKVELEKVKEEERATRLSIVREVKDARLTIASASDRLKAAQVAIDSAREALRVERLKYDTGAGTNTNVIDAQTALLRAETDRYQAIYDREVGFALLRKSMGELTAELGGSIDEKR
jgi:outer membrane protein